MKAIICDKCKRVITNEDELKNIVRLDMCNNYIGKYSEKHLCDECEDKFYTWLGTE